MNTDKFITLVTPATKPPKAPQSCALSEIIEFLKLKKYGKAIIPKTTIDKTIIIPIIINADLNFIFFFNSFFNF